MDAERLAELRRLTREPEPYVRRVDKVAPDQLGELLDAYAEREAYREALLDVYGLLRAGEVSSALHALDAWLIRHGCNPDAALHRPAEGEGDG